MASLSGSAVVADAGCFGAALLLLASHLGGACGLSRAASGIGPISQPASNFRDLALHVSEHPLTLPEIAQFLTGHGLAFRGFQLERGVFARFRETFPGETWPGSLERWAEFEDANPHTFSGMYNLWCTRT